jgi:hypothetical protein
MTAHDPPRAVHAPEPLPEGAEAPPPGVKLAAAVRWGLVAGVAALAVAAWAGWAGAPPAATPGAAQVQYQCPMHPGVLQAGPGACPVCGMDLVPARHGAGEHGVSAEKGHLHGADAPETSTGVPGLAPVELGAERSQRIGVRTAAVARRSLAPEVRATGAIAVDEARVATVSARVTGWVEELLVTEGGARVRKGQALATVYSAELLSAQQAILATPPPAPGQGRPATAAAFGIDLAKRLELLGMARQDVEALRRTGQLRYAQPIRAPIDGHVARRGAFAGQYVQPGVELFQLVDLSTVWLLVDVPEADLSWVRVGARARLAVPAWPGRTFTGRVELLYPAESAETRTIKARVALANEGLALRPGMVGDVALEGAAVDALVVPADAVADTGDRRYVFVARGAGRFEPRAVRTGVRGDGVVQVLDGLAAGDRVVTAASFLVDAESRLRAAADALGAPPAGGSALPASP